MSKLDSFLKTIADSIFPAPAEGKLLISVQQAKQIKEMVAEKTGFDVAYRDTRWAGMRQKPGLVMSPDTAPDVREAAENVFLQALKEVTGRDIKRESIIHYHPQQEVAKEKHTHRRARVEAPSHLEW